MNNLEKNIIATLRFYDFFERPLTGYEIYKCLIDPCAKQWQSVKINKVSPHSDIGANYQKTYEPASLKEILKALEDNEELNQKIEALGGFYCLKQKMNLIPKRIKKEKNSIAKWRKAKKIAKILRFIPYIKMIAISGSLALSNTKPSSDLDFFIVAKNSRIWLCRLLASFITQAMGLRRHGKKIKNRACLNSYVTDKTLEIKTQDLYSASEYLHLIPLWGLGDYQNFRKNNSWINNYFSRHGCLKTANQRIIKDGFAAKLFRRAMELMLNNQTGDWLERLAAKYQKRKILKNPKTGWQNSQIIFNDECLIFHPVPKAPLIEKIMQSYA